MEFQKDRNRIYSYDDEGRLLADITFPDYGDACVVLNHTYVDDSLRGQGVAAALMEAAYEMIKGQEKRCIPTCPYAVKWFDEHPEKMDIMADEEDMA